MGRRPRSSRVLAVWSQNASLKTLVGIEACFDFFTRSSSIAATRIKDVNQPQIEIGIPNWTPGYYSVDDFARNISRLIFTDQNGRAVYHRKLRDSLWSLETQQVTEVRIEFDYTANTMDLNKSLITPNYAILNGTNFFLYFNGHTQQLPASITFKLPDGWRVA
jgi:predicted metalloprotease with PDZ domain